MQSNGGGGDGGAAARAAAAAQAAAIGANTTRAAAAQRAAQNRNDLTPEERAKQKEEQEKALREHRLTQLRAGVKAQHYLRETKHNNPANGYYLKTEIKDDKGQPKDFCYKTLKDHKEMKTLRDEQQGLFDDWYRDVKDAADRLAGTPAAKDRFLAAWVEDEKELQKYFKSKRLKRKELVDALIHAKPDATFDEVTIDDFDQAHRYEVKDPLAKSKAKLKELKDAAPEELKAFQTFITTEEKRYQDLEKALNAKAKLAEEKILEVMETTKLTSFAAKNSKDQALPQTIAAAPMKEQLAQYSRQVLTGEMVMLSPNDVPIDLGAKDPGISNKEQAYVRKRGYDEPRLALKGLVEYDPVKEKKWGTFSKGLARTGFALLFKLPGTIVLGVVTFFSEVVKHSDCLSNRMFPIYFMNMGKDKDGKDIYCVAWPAGSAATPEDIKFAVENFLRLHPGSSVAYFSIYLDYDGNPPSLTHIEQAFEMARKMTPPLTIKISQHLPEPCPPKYNEEYIKKLKALQHPDMKLGDKEVKVAVADEGVGGPDKLKFRP